MSLARGGDLKGFGGEHQALEAQGHLLETFLRLGEVALHTPRVILLHDGQRQVTPDAVQRVVQLVGHAEGELAHDGQMFVKFQALFELFRLGHILHQQQSPEGFGFIRYGKHFNRQVTHPLIRERGLQGKEFPGLLAGQDLLEGLIQAVPVPGA